MRCSAAAPAAAAPVLQDKVQEWLSMDKDAASRAVIQDLMAKTASTELEELMCKRLEFGTAGLRAKMGPGFNRMNPVTIQQTTQGLLKYLQQQAPQQLAENGVIIGFDARHNSKAYAHLAAGVFASAGIKVALPEDFVPTPFIAAGVALLGCAAGVMVTASHNTKEYNGYKVYWGNGCQIIPPHDAGIAAAIQEHQALWEVPEQLPQQLVYDPTQQIWDSYYSKLKQHLHFCSGTDNGQAARVVYTPLHGVGGRFVLQAFQVFGLPAPLVVEAQAQPDPDFPTVSFPNPEEGEGTWQMAFDAAALIEQPTRIWVHLTVTLYFNTIASTQYSAAVPAAVDCGMPPRVATATANNVQLVLANDPDADRLAAAEQTMSPGGTGSGQFTTFSGNDIGLLLADWVWINFKQRHPEVPASQCVMLASAVSSAALGAMAAAEGFQFEQTLTGFKWLGNVAKQKQAQGQRVLFAFEEAIGFMFPDTNMDKDGVSAAAVFAEMAASIYRRGSTVAQHLQDLYKRYGLFVFRASYYIADPPSRSQPVFSRLRSQYPKELGGVKVKGVRDLGTGLDSLQPDGQAVLPWTSGDMMLTLYFEGDGVLTLRASATEPKLKYYLEVKGSAAERAAAERLATQLEAAITSELVQPEAAGIKMRGM
eukprot:gene13121-13251_t